MTLHSLQYWYNVAMWDWVAFEVIDPPFLECLIGADKEGLFRRWGFGKCIRDVSAKNYHILHGRDSIEEAGACLLDTVGVRFRKNTNLARTRGTVTHASSFLPAVDCLDVIGPNKVKYRVSFLRSNGSAKHAMSVVLVQLEVF